MNRRKPLDDSTEQGSTPVTVDDLLLPFEKHNIAVPYRDYLITKRQNFFATVQTFSRLWNCLHRLDEVWLRGLDDLERPNSPNDLLPIVLFSNGHAQFRVAFELGFSTCVNEAWNILRSAVESVAHASKIRRQPEFAEVWLNKNHGRAELVAFKNAFEHNKKKNLFPREYGLDKLQTFWSNFSEWATHTTAASLGARFTSKEDDRDVKWQISYFAVEPATLANSLYYLLEASTAMEDVFFRTFEPRLGLDHELVKKRAWFCRERQSTSQELVRRFKLQPPTVWPG